MEINQLVCKYTNTKKQDIPRMILYEIEIFAIVKRNGFNLKPSSGKF